jgi:hypothetical protein
MCGAVINECHGDADVTLPEALNMSGGPACQLLFKGTAVALTADSAAFAGEIFAATVSEISDLISDACLAGVGSDTFDTNLGILNGLQDEDGNNSCEALEPFKNDPDF